MKLEFTLYAMILVAGLLAVPGPVRADQDAAKDGKKPAPMDARALLEKGRASGALPEGLVIRLGACLGESDVEASGDHFPDELHETWEFTAHQVHRVEFEYKKEKSIYHRVESRPFDSKGLCKELLEGKAIEIQARKGKGPEVGFVGTRYHRGSRSIEVVWNGETILDLHETNGPALHLYRESDARAFGALYERLASQARALVQSKAAEAIQPARVAPPATGTPGTVSKAQALADAFIRTKGVQYELRFERVTDEGTTWRVQYTILKPTQDPGDFWVRVTKETGACEILPGE